MQLPMTRPVDLLVKDSKGCQWEERRGGWSEGTLMGHGLPELLCDERHEWVAQLQQSIKGVHQHLQYVQK